MDAAEPSAGRNGAEPLRLACFVSPHGFGHAARACAVLDALGRRRALAVELFTLVPEWFFRASLAVPFAYHAVRTDVGLAQHDALREDPVGTVVTLDALLPFRGPLLDELAGRVRAAGCQAVLCDIAPLGLAVADRAGLPSALVENFTWDWIYAGYTDEAPGLLRHADYLAGWFARAGLRLQTSPACISRADAITVPPVARRPRRGAAETRDALGIAAGERAVLLTMGGIPWSHAALAPRLPPGVVLVVPGGEGEERRAGDLVLIPFHSRFHHPDLVAACDAVVGKLGYSTFAEAWTSGTAYGFVPRDRFPESPVLAAFVEGAAAGLPVPAGALHGGDWDWLPELLALPRPPAGRPNGDDAAAAALLGWLASDAV